MAKIIGMSDYNFTDKDGRKIAGTTYYYTEPIAPSSGTGEKPDKFSLTPEQKLEYNLCVGDSVTIFFKRNSSKVEAIIFN